MASGDGGSQKADPIRVGLVVIHGVGETEPGYAVNTLLETLSGKVPDYKVSQFSAFQRLKEDIGQADSPTFPVVSRRATHADGTELTGVELHWADLTNLQPGRLNALAGLFRVIFESHHLVDAMLRRGNEVAANVIRALLWFASWMMRGPIAALTIATSAICLFLLFGPLPYAPRDKSWLNVNLGDAQQRFVIVEAILFVLSFAALVWIATKRDISWYDSVFWLAVVTAALLVLNYYGWLAYYLDQVWSLKVADGDGAATGKADCSKADDLGGCYIDGLYRTIIWGWRLYGLVLLIAVVTLAVRALRSGRNGIDAARGPIATSIGIVILQFMMWTTIVVTALYTMLNRAELNRQLSPVRTDIMGIFVEHGVPDDSVAFKLFQFPSIPFDWIDRFKFVYLMTVVTVAICIILTMFLVRKRRRIARRGSNDLPATAKRMSRVLFNPAITGTLITLFLILISLIYFQPKLEKYALFDSVRKELLPIATLIALGMPFLAGHRISNIVHIARDLIDHHYVPRIESATYFFPWQFRARHTRPRRALIQRRLLTLLEQRVMTEKFDVVIFAAHSQGSVVAFDYMRDHLAGHGALGGARPQFMSFGSPLGHIYQKYFYEYVPDGPAWLDVAERVEHWINLYRVDDPIGGVIAVPEGGDIDNVVMPMGGHMGYWNEPELALALHELIQKSKVPLAKAGPPPPPRDMSALRGGPPVKPAAPADLLANTPSRAMPGA